MKLIRFTLDIYSRMTVERGQELVDYYRLGRNIWYEMVGESLEPVYNDDELEAMYYNR